MLLIGKPSISMGHLYHGYVSQNQMVYHTWWLIPLSKWVISPVINGISRVNPLITGVDYNPLTKWDEPPSIPLKISASIFARKKCHQRHPFALRPLRPRHRLGVDQVHRALGDLRQMGRLRWRMCRFNGLV